MYLQSWIHWGTLHRRQLFLPSEAIGKHSQFSDIEECKNNPCRHGGLCMETYGGYTCQCPPGWNGHNCEKDIDECTSSPCQNQGECTNTDGSFKCKCSAYFTGQTCETEIDACKSLECKHGFCTGKGKNAQCQCYGHWMGAKCNETVNMCKKEDTCMNGGACIIDRLMNFTCQCTTGFTGKNCEIGKKNHDMKLLSQYGDVECQTTYALGRRECDTHIDIVIQTLS
ncbi:hypothetical protein D918_01370 [Trichuris suis]|nr:hypothetical protein D918_01370 [Trichuris suis]